MRVIDMHTHIYPDKVARKASIATADYFDLPEPPHHYGSVQELVDVLDEADIDYAMISSAATTIHQVVHFMPVMRIIKRSFAGCGRTISTG